MSSFAIIVPCYNEAGRLAVSSFIEFAVAHADVSLIFVNDGSRDETFVRLNEIQKAIPQTKIISLSKNRGKGEAVRQGLITALQESYDYIGYIDADLSTTLDEFYSLKETGAKQGLDIVLASRIKKMDTQIDRSFTRHTIGRIIATILDQKFKLGVYDTQCGAKIFRQQVLQEIIQQPFFTRWFFDVEILQRIKKRNLHYKAAEIPLRSWHSVRNSKINLLSFPSILKEVIVLLTKY